jgi:hypothetical protein
LNMHFDSGSMSYVINQNSLSAELKENYMTHLEMDELKFIKRSTTDHLVAEDIDIEDKLICSQILKHIKMDKNYKNIEGNQHLLPQIIFFNKFTL